jgi:hypothetical protein
MVKFDNEKETVQLLDTLVRLKLRRRLYPFTFVIAGQ